MPARRLRPRRPLDVGLTLRALWRGPRDPTMRLGPSGVWRATRTPEGAATTWFRRDGGDVVAEAWGPGAAWALEQAPATVGLDDEEGSSSFRPRDPLLADLHRRLAGLRITRSGAVTEALVPTVLEQKVPGAEARAAYGSLCRRFGERAPVASGSAGPGPPLLLPPAPGALARLGYAAFHPFGVERKRADTVRRVASVASRLDAVAGLPAGDGRARLLSVPGVGPWSVAEVARIALGDADAVSVGDYHVPSLVSWALAGEARGDDDRMLELLEPYRGHRGRVQRLLELAGPRPPKFGPRMPLRAIQSI